MYRVRPVTCANCARPMLLTKVSNDLRNPGQEVFSCPSCKLVEIRGPAPQEQRLARNMAS